MKKVWFITVDFRNLGKELIKTVLENGKRIADEERYGLQNDKSLFNDDKDFTLYK